MTPSAILSLLAGANAVGAAWMVHSGHYAVATFNALVCIIVAIQAARQ